MFCRFFILRPVLSIVISIVILIAGGVAIWSSPIAQYPDIVPPVINISATFPGANSEAIANAVAAPIEDQMSGVSDMMYMQSSSANGSSSVSLNVYFQIGTDLNTVLGDVLNRINTAMPQLPIQVQQQGVIVRKKNPDLFLVVPFYSETGNPSALFISNYVYRYVYPIISQIVGVGVAVIHGQRNFAIRVWLDPNKMAYYKLDTADVVAAIKDQNNQYSIGMNAMEPTDGTAKYSFMINPIGYYTDVSQFQNIVIKTSESSAQVVKLKDIADVKLDAQQFATYFYRVTKDNKNKVDIRQAVALLVYLDPSANQLQVKAEINKALTQITKHLPTGIKWYYHYDSSEFVKLSVQQVVETLRDAFILVFLVVMLFIQNLRGTIIPVLAIPVSIIGAFAGTYLLGFSINTLTLFGMVLAIGIVVDDAIVVLENVERIMHTEGIDSTAASIKAMEEVASPVIAIVLVLNAVFIPVAFLGGFAGVLFKQFAVTIAISVFLSGIVALTLTPTLCAIFLRNSQVTHDKPKAWVFEKFNIGFEKLRKGYLGIVSFLIDRVALSWTLFALFVVATSLMYAKIPTSLIPLEDMGYYYTVMDSAPGAALDVAIADARKMATFIEQVPYVDRIAILGGVDLIDNNTIKTSVSSLSVILKPYEERKGKNQDVNAAIALNNKYNSTDKEVRAISFNQPPIRGISPTGGVTFYLEATTDVDVRQVYADSVKLVDYLNTHYPAVAKAHQFYVVDVPQLLVSVDAQKSMIYGVTYAQIYNALQSIFGTYYVNYFTKWSDLYWVVLQADYKFRNRPELLNTVYVRGKKGGMIPVGSLANITYTNGPEVVTRFNDYLASQIVVDPNTAHGYTSGAVMDAVNDAVPKVLGKTYAIKWFGPAYMEEQAGSSSIIAFVLGLIMVFLILAALYELWLLPFAVIMSIPFALFGAAAFLMITGRPNDIYFQVSLITLIGLSAKNAILVVEFALDGVRHDGMSPKEAAIKGAELRFRPIVMTSIAFILGALPLALATGAGANAQRSVGVGIIGGMLGSTIIAMVFVPLFFTELMELSQKRKQKLAH